MTGGVSMRTFLGVCLLAAQLAAVAYAPFVRARYFCWAPYDAISLYTLDVSVDGRALTTEEIARRYRLPGLWRDEDAGPGRTRGRDNRSIQHVIDVLEQYERTYGAGEQAAVVLRYRTNGGEEQVWRWPAR